MTILMSAVEGLAINIGDFLLPVMSALVTGLTEVISFVNQNGDVIAILTAGVLAYTVAANTASIMTSLLAAPLSGAAGTRTL